MNRLDRLGGRGGAIRTTGGQPLATVTLWQLEIVTRGGLRDVRGSFQVEGVGARLRRAARGVVRLTLTTPRDGFGTWIGPGYIEGLEGNAGTFIAAGAWVFLKAPRAQGPRS
jgi:hypothetical protein